jgi:uncharacterized protein YodC (DUF2158 family)
MTVFKSGDLVVLKSGGPTMTVDSVNTSILDDTKITGIVCVWFVGNKLERVRFEHGAIEPVGLEKASSEKTAVSSEEAAGDYKIVIDEMVTAMNTPADAESDAPKTVVKQRKTATAPKHRGTGGIGAVP